MHSEKKEDLAETCVVLAGGHGTRLQAITKGQNKHSVFIAGKVALQHILEPIFSTSSVERVIIVISPNAISWMKDFLTSLCLQKEIHLCIQPIPNGTLAAVQCAIHMVNTENFSVHFGDNIFSWIRLPCLVEFIEKKSVAELYTLQPTITHLNKAHEFGVVEVEENKEGYIATGIFEKPTTLDNLREPRIISGFFRFRTDEFLNVCNKVSISHNGEMELTSAIRLMLELPSPVSVRTLGVSWVDYGTPDNLLRAEHVLHERQQAVATG